jgi:hypothetical protein
MSEIVVGGKRSSVASGTTAELTELCGNCWKMKETSGRAANLKFGSKANETEVITDDLGKEENRFYLAFGKVNNEEKYLRERMVGCHVTQTVWTIDTSLVLSFWIFCCTFGFPMIKRNPRRPMEKERGLTPVSALSGLFPSGCCIDSREIEWKYGMDSQSIHVFSLSLSIRQRL